MLVGVGVAGTLDEVVLHQLLGWHHFYDRSTPSVGLLSDGLFHLASTLALVVGVLGLGSLRGPRAWPAQSAWGAVLVGAGGFNLYDGLIQHKVLKLHQVRSDAPRQLPYDAVFIGLALAVLVVGLAILARERGRSRTRSRPKDRVRRR